MAMAIKFSILIFLFLQLINTNSKFIKTIPSTKATSLLRKQKISHLHFYFHDTLSGKNPTAMPIIPPHVKNDSLFGAVNMIDDPLTETPDPNSKMVGRAQGFYAYAALSEVGLLEAMNFYFMQGKLNGSVLTLLGRNAYMNPVRELPIIGGSGFFRFATGYALLKTHWFDLKSGDAIVEYNVTVLHY